MTTPVGMGVGLALAGIGAGASYLGGSDAAKAKERAIRAAMDREGELTDEERQAIYKAGDIQSGELLKHLQRLSSPEMATQAQGALVARTARASELAGPDGTMPVAALPAVSQAAAGQVAGKAATVQKLDLAQALLGARGQTEMHSGRAADVAASRAAVPLSEEQFRIERARRQNQIQLAAALGTDAGSGLSLAGTLMQGAAPAAMLF